MKKLLLIFLYCSIFLSCKKEKIYSPAEDQNFLEKYLGVWEFSKYTSTTNPYGTHKDTTIFTDTITYGTDSTLLIPLGSTYREEITVDSEGEMSNFPAHYNYWSEGYFINNTVFYVITTSGSPFQQTNQIINGKKIE